MADPIVGVHIESSDVKSIKSAPQDWLYKVVAVPRLQAIQGELDRQGAASWELVCVVEGQFIFKMPVTSD